MADLCTELSNALNRTVEAEAAYNAAQAALALSVEDRLERDIGLDLFGFILDGARRHEQTLRKLHTLFCKE